MAEVADVGRARSAVVVCDHQTGRERRGRTVRESYTRGGRAFIAAAASNTQVAWIEATFTRSSARIVLVQAPVRSRVPAQRRVLYTGRIPLGSTFGVVFTRGGKLVYSTPAGLHVGGRRVVDGPVFSVDIEDGTTLRFLSRRTGRTYLELSPVRRDRAGCPVRERFRRVYSSGQVVLSMARYGDDSFNFRDVWRACLPGSRRDPVVSEPVSAQSAATGPLLGVDAPWVLTGGAESDKYGGCSTTMRAVNVQTGRPGPSSSVGSCDPLLLPAFGDPIAVTERGRFAWLERGPDVWRLQLASGSGSATTTLQAGPPGTIGAPSASGAAILWTTSDAPQAHSVTPD